MKRRLRTHTGGLVALVLIVASLPVFAVAFKSEPAAGGTTPLGATHLHLGNQAKQERYLYVATIAKSATDPDFVAVVGVDPSKADFGKIVNRVDMPNVGDELHHFGYSARPAAAGRAGPLLEPDPHPRGSTTTAEPVERRRRQRGAGRPRAAT